MDIDLKRWMDVGLAGCGLVLLAPLFLVVGGVLLLTLGRPILFRQTRPGLRSRAFQLLKFRTMTHPDDASGPALPDSARLTAIGKLLRASSIDELPELWNVVRGHMSLVGPRPLLMEYLPLYTERQSRRHEVRPGITGWAQVNGRNVSGWEARLEMDVWYVENRTLGLDLKIIALTIWKVLRRDGISHPGHATMPAFRGNAE